MLPHSPYSQHSRQLAHGPGGRRARLPSVRGRTKVNRTSYDGTPWLVGVAACAVTIACVPMFSHQEGISHITQFIALVAVGLAGMSLFIRIPRFHPAIIAYALLIAFWGVFFDSALLDAYLTMVKLTVLAFAVHILVRTERHLLIVLGAYCASGVIALALNWGDISDLRSVMVSGEALTERMRLDGTFANANRAGIYAMNVALFGLIVFFNSRNPVRWLFLLSGVAVGVIIGALSGSRKAMLGMILVGMAVPFISFSGKRGELGRWIKNMLLAACAAGLVIAVLSQTPFLDRLVRLQDGAQGDGSARIRMEMARATIVVWWSKPFAGVGFRGFAEASGLGRYSHTTFGEVLANGGMIGFGLISIFYVWPAIQLARLSMHRGDTRVRRLAIGLLVFWGLFFMNSLFSVQYGSRDMIPLWAGICGWLSHIGTPQRLALSATSEGASPSWGSAAGLARDRQAN